MHGRCSRRFNPVRAMDQKTRRCASVSALDAGSVPGCSSCVSIGVGFLRDAHAIQRMFDVLLIITRHKN